MAVPVALTGSEWLIIGVIVVVIFGAGAIPKLAKAIGRAKGEYQLARKDVEREMQSGEKEAGAAPSEEQVRRTARELGIQEQGMDLAAVKQAINQRMG